MASVDIVIFFVWVVAAEQEKRLRLWRERERDHTWTRPMQHTS